MRRTRYRTQDTELKTGNRKPATRNRTPLAEGIRNRKTWGFFSRMYDKELVLYAKELLKEKGISGRGELKKAVGGLYGALRKRGLVDEVVAGRKQRPWKEMNDEELIEYAKEFMKENEISGRKELQKADRGLYQVLRKRGLLDEVVAGRKQRKRRPWKKMSDEEIIEYAKRVMKEKGINGREEMCKEDPGLYDVLRKRGLVDKLVAIKQRKKRPWKEMRDRELIEHAKEFRKLNGISGRKELYKADPGLYEVLRIRGLLDKTGIENKNKHFRDWTSMTDRELVSYARKYMMEKGISGRKELHKADRGLYDTLKRRRLLDKVRFEKKRGKMRSWNKMKNEGLLEHAKEFMKEKRIRGRTELSKADRGLYDALRKRGLLDKLVAGRTRRLWKEMNDEELIEYAKEFRKLNGISGRKEFYKADQGLYEALRRRKLLNLVFSDIEKSQSEKAIEQIIDFTAGFGERG